ncbi:MAG: segregation/condensation protein A [Clostridia bacterium]|nr:segregation/condensation protein A [Clostridia bacterium]
MDSILYSPINEVTYHLENQEFDGPLDLLLTMVREAKIDIRDIFITDITNQFVAYIQSLTEMNYEYIAEYITLAATLLAIKSAKFLPKTDIMDEDAENLEQEEENLFLRIEAYKKFKDAAEKLHGMESLHRFYRLPKFTEKDYRAVVKDFRLDRLIECFKMLLERIEHLDKPEEEKTIIKERFTISDKILEISKIIREKGTLNFFSLFERDFTKLEMINTFLALLEILRKQIALAEQGEGFGDIIIRHNAENDTVVEEEELTIDVEEYN